MIVVVEDVVFWLVVVLSVIEVIEFEVKGLFIWCGCVCNIFDVDILVEDIFWLLNKWIIINSCIFCVMVRRDVNVI